MTFYRNAVWFVKGMREYTKSGYETAAKKFHPGDLDVDLTGKAFLITGANSGIGKETAREIAKRGGTVHLVCRNVERGEEAKSEILSQFSSASLHVHRLDISDPRAVHAFVRDFSASGQPLHCLVNNAGCMINERTLTADEVEANFAANTLGTFVLTTELLAVLRHHAAAGDTPRVVTVTSGGMLTQKLDTTDLMSERGNFDGTMAYAQQKRQQVVLTELWAKNNPEVHFSCGHPGWADTPAVRTSMPGFYEKMKDKLRTPQQGSDTIVWLAVSEAAVKMPSGLFFQDRQPAPTHLPLARTKSLPEDEAKLVQCLQNMSKKYKSTDAHVDPPPPQDAPPS